MNAKQWNELHEPGIDVVVTLDSGEHEFTKTRSVAWTLDSGTSVVLLEGRTGGYLLSRVAPANSNA